ncbi:MAG: M20/M25/M40 family metallo-hydrolase [Reyranellaceae bacterium]
MAPAITDFKAGIGWGGIPGAASLKGTFRSYKPEGHQAAEATLRRVVDGIEAAYGAQAALKVAQSYPSMRSDKALAAFAAETAAEIFGAEHIDGNCAPSLASEDFAYYADHVKCAYGWIGNGDGAEGCAVHNAHYDFNDRILANGASYFARLAERSLPAE